MLPISQLPPGRGGGRVDCPILPDLPLLCLDLFTTSNNDFYNTYKKREKMLHLSFPPKRCSFCPAFLEVTPAMPPGLRASSTDPRSSLLLLLFCPCGTSVYTPPHHQALRWLPASLGVKIKLSPCSEVFRVSALNNRTEQSLLLQCGLQSPKPAELSFHIFKYA